MIDLIKKYISPKFLRFLIVGVINTSINYGIFYALLKILDYRLSGAIGFMSGALSGFFLNRSWTFNSDVKINSGILKYFLVQLFCLLVHEITIITATELFRVPKVFSQLAGIFVTTFLNYFLIKRIVFKENTYESCCLSAE